MGRQLSQEIVTTNKDSAIRALDNLLTQYIEENDTLKKADLISFWLKSYAGMIRFEERFDPKKNKSYKRGDIIKVDFGFNIGAEYGGRHYAVVLDKKNAHNSPVITVVPLTSKKEGRKPRPYEVDLGTELYRSLWLKASTVRKKALEDIKQIENTRDTLVTVQENSGSLEYNEMAKTISDLSSDLENQQRKIEAEVDELEAIANEIQSMKHGSIALANQIATISKIRIVDPKHAKGILSGVRLSEEGMNAINEKVKELFIWD